MRLEANDLRDLQLLKYYRVVRRWFCKHYELNEADLELLIYFDCIGIFTRNDFVKGTYIYSWDKHRWERLVRDGWIVIYTHRNRTTIKYNKYKVSTKCKLIINRIYKILLNQEDLPQVKNKETYSSKVLDKAVDFMNTDKTR